MNIIDVIISLGDTPDDALPPGQYCCRIAQVMESGPVRAVFTGVPHHLMTPHLCVPLTVTDAGIQIPRIPALTPEAAYQRHPW